MYYLSGLMHSVGWTNPQKSGGKKKKKGNFQHTRTPPPQFQKTDRKATVIILKQSNILKDYFLGIKRDIFFLVTTRLPASWVFFFLAGTQIVVQIMHLSGFFVLYIDTLI